MSFIYRSLLGFCLFISHLTANLPHSNEDSWASGHMTPQEIRCYAYYTAKDFSLAVSQVLSLSKNEDTFQQALDIWQDSSMALFKNVCYLRENVWSSSLSQTAADEVLDLIHVLVIGAFVDTDLVHLLSTCAWHSLDESSALEFENRFSEYFFQLLSRLNPSSNPPTHIRMEVFHPNFSWNSITLCKEKKEEAKGVISLDSL